MLVSALFSDNLAAVLDILTLQQDKHNIRTLSVNIKFICTCHETGQKSLPETCARNLLSYLFLKLVRINFIFADNVCLSEILFLSLSNLTLLG